MAYTMLLVVVHDMRPHAVLALAVHDVACYLCMHKHPPCYTVYTVSACTRWCPHSTVGGYYRVHIAHVHHVHGTV